MPSRSLLLATLALSACLSLAAPLAAQTATGPDAEAETTDTTFQALPLDPLAFTFADEEFARVASRISLGTATLQERRWWYRAAERYAPFEGAPAPDWKLRAFRADQALSTAAASLYAWSPIGPNGNYETARMNGGPGALDEGRVTAVWTHLDGTRAVNRDVIFVGTADGGLWKTIDGGQHWQPLTDAQPSLAIGALDVLPGSDLTAYSDATIYAGTGEGNFSQPDKDGVGVLKSTDGGRTWTVQPLPFRGDAVGIPGQHRMRRLRIDRSVPGAQSVWVAGDGGVYHTTDGGTTWQLVTGLPYTGAPTTAAYPGGCWMEYATDLVIDGADRPQGFPVLVAAFGRVNNATCAATGGVAQTAGASRVNNGIYRSLDGGVTWQKLAFDLQLPGGAPGDLGRITLLSAPSNPKHLYVLTARTVDMKSGGLYSTLDVTAPAVTFTAGATTEFTNGQGWYDLAGAVKPGDENTLMVGGLDNYLSTDGGKTLKQVSVWSAGDSSWSHADHHAALWVDDTTYYDGNDGGFFVGTVQGTSVTWSHRNGGGLATLQFYGLSQSARDPYLINGGLQDNGHALLKGGRWQSTYGGDGGFAATSQDDDSQVWEEYVYGAIRHSDSGGDGFLDTGCMQTYGGCPGNCGTGTACNPDQHSAFIAHFSLDAGNQKVMYVGTNLLYRNLAADQASPVWQPMAAGGTAGDFVYGNTSSRAYIDVVHTPRLNKLSSTPVPYSQILYVGTSTGRIWRTDDGGLTWRDLTKAPLPVTSTTTGRALTWIDTDPTNPDHVVITYSGWAASTSPAIPGHVFRSLDGGATWSDASGALPDEPFNTVAVNPNAGRSGEVFVGSDSGVYVDHDLWGAGGWTRINNGLLPNVSVNMLEFTNATSPKRLRAATHGRGIWELYEQTQQTLTVDKPTYGCSDRVAITLLSTALGQGSQTVLVTSMAEPAGETVTLLESPLGSGHYVGTLPTVSTTAAAGDGQLTVWNADRIVVAWSGATALQATAAVDCSSCDGSAAAGGNLRVDSSSLSVEGGDGDEFLDNCEHGDVAFALRNTGAGPLTNVRVARVTTSNPGVRVHSLPVLAGSLAQCATALGAVRLEAAGLTPGERLTVNVDFTSDELAAQGLVRTLTVAYDPVEQDFTRVASKTFSFDDGMDGWNVVDGFFGQKSDGGANQTPGYLASSSLTSGVCDEVRSPVLKLSATSTLTVYNQYVTEPMSDAWYDRGNVGLFDVASGTRTTIVPSGGRPYLASGPNGVCVLGGQPGWAGPGPGWLPSSWTAADLGTAQRAGQRVQLDVAYGTDASVSGLGLQIDEVTLTDFDLQGPDAQGDACAFCTPQIDDADPSVEYTGGWHQKSDPNATGGAYHVRVGNNPQGAAAKLSFEGTSVTYLYATSSAGGSADLYLDGARVATISYASKGGIAFGASWSRSGLPLGDHTLEVRQVSGAVYVDGFRFDCASGGSGADAGAPAYGTQQSTSTATATDGPVITRTVQVKAGDVGVSVLVDGLPAAVTIQLLGPLGDVVASGGQLLAGFTLSGLDAGALPAGTYSLKVPNDLLPGQTASVSIVRTFHR